MAQKIGTFRLEERIGRGGMGEVWRAWDEDLRRFVAIKLVHGESAADVERRAVRLRREALTAARLSHPVILQVHGFLHQDDQLGIVMELVEGRSLSEILREGIPAFPRLLLWIREITEGLAYAHEQGVVHRDLKPGNIMIFEAGGTEHAKILDFGLARDLEQTRSTSLEGGRLMGTLSYMSPEQARGESSIDHRSDLFSLGVLIYRAATGEPPFRGGSAGEILGQVMMHRPLPFAALRPDLPPDLGKIVDRMLEKAPKDRFQSARDVLRELGRLTGDPSSPGEPFDAPLVVPAYSIDTVTTQKESATIVDEPSLESTGPRRQGVLRRMPFAMVFMVLVLVLGYLLVLDTASRKLENSLEGDDYSHRLAMAQQAEEWARVIRDRDLVADSLFSQGDALFELEDYEETRKLLDAAEGFYASLGDDVGVTNCRELLIQRLYRLGDVDGARRLAIRYINEVPETYEEGVARLSNTLGLILTDYGESEEAKQYFARAAEIYSTLDSRKQQLAVVYNSQGIALQGAGALRAAQEKYGAAREIFAQEGDRGYEAYMLNNLGECFFYFGRLEESEENHRKALEINRTIKDEYGEAYDLYRLGEVARVRGDFDIVEGKYYDPAARLAPDDSFLNARIDLGRARLALAREDPTTAEEKARYAEQVLRHDEQAAEAMLARTVLVHALLAQEKLAEAVALADSIEPTSDPRTRFALALLNAELKRRGVIEGNPSRKLDVALAEAEEKGYLEASFELRLALSALASVAGVDVESRLADLEEEAREAGFHGLVREIAQRRQAHPQAGAASHAEQSPDSKPS